MQVPRLYNAMRWARNEELMRFIAILDAPMWLVNAYFSMRELEIRYGPESTPTPTEPEQSNIPGMPPEPPMT